MQHSHDLMPSPIGALTLYVDETGALTAIDFEDERPRRGGGPRDPRACRHVRAQLEEYFAGRRRSFDLALNPKGSEFQQRVWQALRQVPYGTTLSYGALARRLGAGTSPRAVGTANGANPIPIVIPCHRVIGADGSLTGYGGGLDRKARLLAFEGAPVQSRLAV